MRIKFEIDNSHKLEDSWRGQKTELIIPHEDLLKENFVKQFILSCWGGPNRSVEITYLDCEADTNRNCWYSDNKIHGVKQNYTMFRDEADDNSFLVDILHAIEEDLEKIYSMGQGVKLWNATYVTKKQTRELYNSD